MRPPTRKYAASDAAGRRSRPPSTACAWPPRGGLVPARLEMRQQRVAAARRTRRAPSCSSAGRGAGRRGASGARARWSRAWPGSRSAPTTDAFRRRRSRARRRAWPSRSTMMTGPSLSRCCAYGNTLRAHWPSQRSVSSICRTVMRIGIGERRAAARGCTSSSRTCRRRAASGRRRPRATRSRASRPAGNTRAAPATTSADGTRRAQAVHDDQLLADIQCRAAGAWPSRPAAPCSPSSSGFRHDGVLAPTAPATARSPGRRPRLRARPRLRLAGVAARELGVQVRDRARAALSAIVARSRGPNVATPQRVQLAEQLLVRPGRWSTAAASSPSAWRSSASVNASSGAAASSFDEATSGSTADSGCSTALSCMRLSSLTASMTDGGRMPLDNRAKSRSALNWQVDGYLHPLSCL